MYSDSVGWRDGHAGEVRFINSTDKNQKFTPQRFKESHNYIPCIESPNKRPKPIAKPSINDHRGVCARPSPAKQLRFIADSACAPGKPQQRVMWEFAWMMLGFFDVVQEERVT